MNTEDARRWAMVRRRDAVEGEGFVYAVQTTGIFCRPGCPSRRPREANVEFFDGADQALRAGYRPCRRCRPDDEAYREPNLDRILAACRLMRDSPKPPSLAAMADAAGQSPGHFRRSFRQVLGISPKEFAASVQADRFLQGLERGLPVAAAIYDAGYSSPSRAYDGLRKTSVLTPTELRSGGDGLDIDYAVVESALGATLVAFSPRGVCAVMFDDDPSRLPELLDRRFPRARRRLVSPEASAWIRQAVSAIENPRRGADIPLDIRGTAFQRRVWAALQEIPPGETACYADIAARIGAPGSTRAVAGACASNAIAFFIPCHRIIRKDGGLGGYRWGVERKAMLLKSEKER